MAMCLLSLVSERGRVQYYVVCGSSSLGHLWAPESSLLKDKGESRYRALVSKRLTVDTLLISVCNCVEDALFLFLARVCIAYKWPFFGVFSSSASHITSRMLCQFGVYLLKEKKNDILQNTLSVTPFCPLLLIKYS